MSRRWYLTLRLSSIFVWAAALAACAPGNEVLLASPPGEPAAPAAPFAPQPAAALDKWALWAGGTQLRGANIWQRIVVSDLDGPDFLGSGYVGPPYTQEDFDRLAALGANYVNISHPGLFTERPPYVLDEEVQANLDRLLEMAVNADLFVVITFRTGAGRSDFTFYRDGAGDWFEPDLLIEWVWSDAAAQDAWVEMWRYTAERYKDNPVVVGYDLMCEPNSDDVALGIYDAEEFYPQYAGSMYDWNVFYPRLVAAIRAVDVETPILVSSMGWGNLAWLSSLEPLDDAHIVYAFHQYEPHEYTHQEVGEGRSYPGRFDADYDGSADVFDQAWLEDWLAIGGDFTSQHGAPLAVNEYGVTRWAPGAAAFMRDEMTSFEQYGWNYALWVWGPAWEAWTQNVNDFNFRFGPDPENYTDVTSSDLIEVITDFWARNTLRPSDFASNP